MVTLRYSGNVLATGTSFCFGLLTAFVLITYRTSEPSTSRRLSVSTSHVEIQTSHVGIQNAAQIPNQSLVYRWTGNQWQQLVNFCTWSDFPGCVMLKTQNGPTPIFHHDPKNDYTSRMLISTGVKEPETISTILDYLANDLSITFLDVGSHVGSIALQMAKAGYKIVTVDPLPENVGRLCKSVQTGQLVDKFTILFTPVSDAHKTVAFIREWNIGATKVEVVTSEKNMTSEPSCKLSPLKSKTATLDDVMPFIKSQKVFIKIDVESHEYFVMKGGKDLFKQREVVGVFMEWIHVKKTAEAQLLIDLLNQLGFTAYNLGKKGQSLKNSNYKNWPMDIFWKRAKQ